MPFEKQPKYLGVTLDHTLTFKCHFTQTAAKVQAHNNLIRRLAGTTWGANYNTVKVLATALWFSVAEYCAPVWYNSVHTRLVDRAFNESMQIVSECIRSTPVEQPPVLCGILPFDLRREKTCLTLLHRAMADDDHLLHHWTDANYAILTRLPGRPPSRRMRSLFNEAGPSHPATFAADKWQLRWNNSNSNLKTVYMPKASETPLGCHLQRKEWVRLNRIRCGHGRFNAALHKWGLCESPLCHYGVLQTAHHVIYDSVILKCPGDLAKLDNPALEWLRCDDIDF